MKRYCLLIFSLSFFCVLPVNAENGQLVGQGNDGNRGTPVHRIEMYSDDGVRIRSYHKNPKPFSTRQTCGRCHDYAKIASGWHFNGHKSEELNDEGELVKIDWGRPAQPWVLTDPVTRTQVPISGRQWPGTFTPEQMGITPWEFVNQNFSHFPGGSYGEVQAEHPYESARQMISGSCEINCLACHNADSHQDQDMAALQAARQNYRWIPAASSQMAVVNGVASELSMFHDPQLDEGHKVTYKEGLFDSEDLVFFDITGRPSNERCYFCHSNQNLSVGEENEWTRDEDVHLKAGLNCVDCHRNGDDHMITRGTETEGHGTTLSCEGCHLGEAEDRPGVGRMGAPKPAHRGIPTIHFEKMTCTACHSGPRPSEQADRWKTARMHKTGLHGKHAPHVPQPHVYAPVLMKGADGKIGPYKLFWPAYWAYMKEDSLTPIAPDRVMELSGNILNTYTEKVDDWRPLTEDQIAGVLAKLSSDDKKAIYIAGGKMYQLSGDNQLQSSDPPLAQPYAWPMAHDVRPAEQSLGVRKCKDCHTTDSAVFFGNVEVDSPVKAEGTPEFIEMIELQGIDRLYMRTFNASFMFRPFLKIIALASCGLVVLVLLAYIVRAVAAISNACVEESD
ncbi:MAG: hypothetical protein ABFR90_06435 [Planctomycetota bacterium]